MKFGYVTNLISNYSEAKDLAIKAEDVGFDSFHINDHFMMGNSPLFEAGMLAAAIAIETHKMKIGHIVLCNSYRNPALLAKMISTLDNISNGRALMWLGAGWLRTEYLGYGYPFPSPKIRVDELEESLKIFKKAFTEKMFSFDGQFWKLKRMRNYPKPIQKPYPQIVLGTNGTRMTDIACREADGINLPALTIDQLPQRISFILENLKKYNRNPSDFEISLFNNVKMVNNQEELDKLKEEQIKNGFIGFPEDIKKKIAYVEDLGVKKLVFAFEPTELEDPFTIFRNKVM